MEYDVLTRYILLSALHLSHFNLIKDKLDLTKLAPYRSELSRLFRHVIDYHDKYGEDNPDLTLEELQLLVTSEYSALSTSNKRNMDELFARLKADRDSVPSSGMNIESLFHLLEAKVKKDTAKEILDEAARLFDSQVKNTDNLKELLSKYDVINLTSDMDEDVEELHVTVDDLDTLLNTHTGQFTWGYNLPPLQEATGGLLPASFGIVAGRPDGGKTAFYLSLCCNEGGFLSQGAKVHVWRNEETHAMIVPRALSSMSGVPNNELLSNIQSIKTTFNKELNNLFILKDDTTDAKSIQDIEKYMELHKNNMDILIIDQLDNVLIGGKSPEDRFALKELYQRTRFLAKRYNCAIIAICQAGSGAEDKLYYTYNELDESKTGKPGAVDYIFLIGQKKPTNGEVDSGFRVLNFAKNKPFGPKPPVQYVLNHPLTRIEA